MRESLEGPTHHPALHTCDEAHAGQSEGGSETVRWGSVAAQEAVERICQEVALRCQRIIDMYSSASTPDEDGHHRPDPRSSGPTMPQLAETLVADTTLPTRGHIRVQQPVP
ncbi:MAG: hypothetical protein ACRDSG_00200 [Pseudonocardiaceae bacterium]